MNINYKRFFSKYWYPVSIIVFFAGFMTPGITLFSFILFIFVSGFATRPYFDGLVIEKFYPKERNHQEPLPFAELRPKRKKV